MREVTTMQMNIEELSDAYENAVIAFNNCNALEWFLARCSKKGVERLYIKIDGKLKSFDREI